jgi:hypothetical protein
MDMSSLSLGLAVAVLICWLFAGVTAVIASSMPLRRLVIYDGIIEKITFAFDMLGILLLMVLAAVLATSG